jgi:DNA-binding response OmpR family regulator
MKILIVDDSTVNNIMLENLFTDQGYETYSLVESESVMEVLNTFHPDIILLDIMMPGMSGFDILKRMKEQSINIPTIILTAYKNQDYERQAKELGAKAYFTKPFNHQDLIKAIKDATSQ